jgi:histidine triad (HIT) family protein
MTDCIFCRIARHEIPANVVREDDDCIAIRDLQPRAPVHVLVIPKRHVASVTELDESDETLAGHLLVVAREVARADGVAESGYRLVLNAGPDAGQSVDHLHLHVLGGREFGWPPG